MEPVLRSLPREEPSYAATRAIYNQTRRKHEGTLNIFAATTTNDKDDCCFVAATSRGISRGRSNDESHETREFLWPRLRRVSLPEHSETPRGLRHFSSAAGGRQNIQVVGITDAYKDPHSMPRSRSGVRCASRGDSPSMWDIMSRPACPSTGSRCRPCLRVVDYTLLERFCQAVRDHAQHRRGGVTGFYVNLARGCVGSVAAEAPAETPREWRLLDPPRTHTLTLGSCRDQLQSLTGIQVSLQELFELLWGAKGDCSARDGDCGAEGNDEQRLHELVVPYRVFSAAFGDNTEDDKLSVLKI